MQNYRKGAHTLYDLKYHIVWVTKYRKPILTTRRAIRTRDLIREIARSKNVQILKGHVSKDHVHLFLSVPPSLSIATLVQYLKGKTSRKLLMEDKALAKTNWGQHLWARGYFATTSGVVTDETIMNYIENQDDEILDREDGFSIHGF